MNKATSINIEDEVFKLYIEDRLDSPEIGRRLKLSIPTVLRMVRHKGGEPRSYSEAASLPKTFTELVNSLYWGQRLSSLDIARITGHGYRAVLRHLKKGRGVRTFSEATKISTKKRLPLSEETKRKLSIATRSWMSNPYYRKKVMASRRPTRLEAKLIEIIREYKLPYKYTGDGSFLIGNLNPDFVNTDGDKIAIEVFGNYWHSPSSPDFGPRKEEEYRRKVLSEYGWSLIVIWESELKELSKDQLAERIAKGLSERVVKALGR